MEGDFQPEAAVREAARQVHELEAMTAAQAMPAFCFLLGAYRRGVASADAETEPVGRTRHVRLRILGARPQNREMRERRRRRWPVIVTGFR